MLGILTYKAWLIEPAFASRLAPIIMRAIEQGTSDLFFKQQRENNDKILSGLYAGIEMDRVREDYNEPAYYTAKAKNGGKVAIVPMMGAITKNGDACSFGMRDYQNALTRIAAKADISAVVLHHNNTPGGTHDGTPELAAMIKGFSKSSVTFVDGYSASAHYYMASQSNHIMMNKLTPSEVGSIGSLMVHQNIDNVVAAGNLPKMEIIRAPQSYNKALFNSIEPLTDELRSEVKGELKDIVKTFIGDVKKGRAGKLADDPEMFTGKMYGTEEAIANGLADSKGTLQDAINKAAELATTKSTSTANKAGVVNTNMSFKSKLFSSLFGKSEKAAEEPKPTADEPASMEAADAKAVEMEAENVQLKAERDAHAVKIAEHENTVAGLNAQIATLTEEKAGLQTKVDSLTADLAKKPTGQATTVITEASAEEAVTADVQPTAKENPFRTKADEQADAYIAQIYPPAKSK